MHSTLQDVKATIDTGNLPRQPRWCRLAALPTIPCNQQVNRL